LGLGSLSIKIEKKGLTFARSDIFFFFSRDPLVENFGVIFGMWKIFWLEKDF